MEKTIKWDLGESTQMQQIETERTQVLAQIGTLMMNLETAKTCLEAVNEKYRMAVRQVLNNRGIGNFDSARPIPDGIILQISDNGA